MGPFHGFSGAFGIRSDKGSPQGCPFFIASHCALVRNRLVKRL